MRGATRWVSLAFAAACDLVHPPLSADTRATATAPAASMVTTAPLRYAFDLTWEADGTVPESVDGLALPDPSISVEGTLILETTGPEGRTARLSMRDVELRAGGNTTTVAMDGCSAWISLEAGPPDALFADAHLDEPCRQILTHVALALDWRSESPTDERPVLTSYGVMHASHARAPGLVSRSVRGTVQGHDGHGFAELELDAEGRVVAQRSSVWVSAPGPEQAPLTTSRISLARRTVEPAELAVPDWEALQQLPLLPVVDGTEARRAEALAYADGLDAGMLLLDIVHVERGGTLRRGFAIRARGLMLAEPELAQEVAAQFVAVGRESARALVVDLLSQAGTPVAQRELRRILAQVVDSEADDRGPLLQRLGLLDEPERASMALGLSLHARAVERGDDETRRASLYVLGMLAARAGREDGDLVDQLLERLHDEADDSRDRAVRQAALAGLGNTADPSVAATLLSASADPEPALRASAAVALRTMPPEIALPPLRRMLGDDSSLVTDAARLALAHVEGVDHRPGPTG